MSQKIFNDSGEEIEVYTADEVEALKSDAIKAKEEEFGTTLTAKETELAEAKKALGERAGEFKQFRKLTDDTVAKLGLAEQTIYANQLAMEEMRLANEENVKKSVENSVDTAIRARVGSDDKLYTKVKEVYSVLGIRASTNDEITSKVNMAIGAIGISEPDLMTSLGFSGGSFQPAGEKTEETKSYADTEAGKSLAANIGLKL